VRRRRARRKTRNVKEEVVRGEGKVAGKRRRRRDLDAHGLALLEVVSDTQIAMIRIELTKHLLKVLGDKPSD